MKERGILFSAPMVRALLSGAKTQTRRVVKGIARLPPNPADYTHNGHAFVREEGTMLTVYPLRCPYGAPGDRLWVRETWAVSHAIDHLKPREVPQGSGMVYYAATENLGGLMKRPSIFMPRWASRLTLEITDISVERLQDISNPDARAEGAPDYEEGLDAPPPDGDHEWSYRASYRRVWESINGAGSWDANPWVWVVEFKALPTGATNARAVTSTAQQCSHVSEPDEQKTSLQKSNQESSK